MTNQPTETGGGLTAREWVFVNTETGTVDSATGDAWLVSSDDMTDDERERMSDAADLGGYTDMERAVLRAHGVPVSALVDAWQRWRAFCDTDLPSGATWGTMVPNPRPVRCAGCELASGEMVLLDPRTAAVVPAWDVAGNRRSWVFACDECAAGVDSYEGPEVACEVCTADTMKATPAERGGWLCESCAEWCDGNAAEVNR